MRKFLMVIALAVISTALIVGGIVLAAYLGSDTVKTATNLPNVSLLSYAPVALAGCISCFLGGIGCGIATIANFFTAKTYDK